MTLAADSFAWWQTGVVYQIYPRSFKDSSGDGIGDLQGIIDQLDYLNDGTPNSLGVDAIWISPIYPSPMADFGYDISNYIDIHPMFGNLDTFDCLLTEAHRRGMRVILDYVPNHTSDEHPWFVESRSSRDNPKRNWYIWRNARPGGSPPNNWGNAFGGSAWTWDDTTEQYYLHLFHAKQPDLNWRNPEVQQAMLNVLRFWFDRGVDGFRVDVAGAMIKDERLRDNPYRSGAHQERPNFIWGMQEHVYDLDRPEVHSLIREFRRIADSYEDKRVLIGEVWFRPISRWVRYYGEKLEGFHLPFNFGLLQQPWLASAMRAAINEMEEAIPAGAWPNNVLGNHDSTRLATRFGREAIRPAAMMLLTLRGTPTIYMGEEIGMQNGDVPLDRLQDPPALIIGPEYGRDGCRTPFEWTAEKFAGFSTVEPWLPVAEGYQDRCVETQKDDPQSVLELYRRLIWYRKTTPALNRGIYHSYDQVPADCFVYLRELGPERRLIAINFGSRRWELDLSEIADQGQVVMSTKLDRAGTENLSTLALRPYEGVIVEL